MTSCIIRAYSVPLLEGFGTRKVKKLNLLEFTGGCRMNGQFTKVGLNLT